MSSSKELKKCSNEKIHFWRHWYTSYFVSEEGLSVMNDDQRILREIDLKKLAFFIQLPSSVLIVFVKYTILIWFHKNKNWKVGIFP